MKQLLGLSRVIDKLSNLVGSTIIWLVLATVLVSAVNANVRKVLNNGSNA